MATISYPNWSDKSILTFPVLDDDLLSLTRSLVIVDSAPFKVVPKRTLERRPWNRILRHVRFQIQTGPSKSSGGQVLVSRADRGGA